MRFVASFLVARSLSLPFLTMLLLQSKLSLKENLESIIASFFKREKCSLLVRRAFTNNAFQLYTSFIEEIIKPQKILDSKKIKSISRLSIHDGFHCSRSDLKVGETYRFNL